MDFFAQQLVRKRQSLILLVGFVFAMLAMALLINAVITVFSMLVGQDSSLWSPSAPALVMIAIVWMTIVAGGFFRYLDVRAGGAVLARRFGAVHASNRSRHEQENVLLNVVAEVSIASSTAQPEVYVMRHESSINALVLGNSVGRTVIVVTQGALDAFDRDELQAVVAHEFGHIANGDLPLNMRLLIVLGGLMAIDEVGRGLYARGPDDALHPGVIVGALLIGLGSVGVLFGKLIQAAFSRQREFLADASAAQFTRNPTALASALDVIRNNDHEPALHSAHCHELAHLCFQTGSSAGRWYRRLLASHPTLQSRIEAIDPHFTVKQRKLKNRDMKNETTSTTGGLQSPSLPAEPATESVFNSDGSFVIEETTVSEPSDRIVLLLPDDSSCLAALFAIFASNESDKRKQYLNSLAFSVDQKLADSVKHLLTLLPEEFEKDQLGIINHVTGYLSKRLNRDIRCQLIRKVEQLITINNDYDLMNYATIQLIRRKLEIEFPMLKSVASDRTPVAKARKAKTFESMGSEFALLLSLMVEASGASSAQLDEQFQKVLKCYTQSSFPRRTANETGIIDELEAAFQTLYVQPRPIRQAFVQHCMEIMQEDGYIMPTERALLELFAASLRCEELIAA